MSDRPTPRRAGSRRGAAAAAILIPLAYPALAALFLYDVVLTGRAYLFRDILALFHPWQSAIRESVRAGALPFWNHATSCGLPLLGSPEAGFFYPLNWLYWFLPFDAALAAGMVLHLALAGVFLRGFLRRAGLADPAALLGGALLAFGVWPLSHLGSPMMLGAAVWLPMAWCGVWDAMHQGKRHGLGTLALAIVLSFLAGYPQITGLGLLSTALLSLFLAGWVISAKGLSIADRIHRLVALPIALIVAGLVAGAQLAPAGDAVNDSTNITTYSAADAMSRSLPPKGLVGLVDPFFSGLPGADRYWGGDTAEFPYGAIYVGGLGLVLVVASIPAFRGARRTRRVRREDLAAPVEDPIITRLVPPFLTVGVLLGVLLTLGRYGPLWGILHGHLPGFAAFRFPATAAFLISVHAAPLAAIGFAWCSRDAARWRAPSMAAAAVGVVLLLGALLAGGPLAETFRTLQLAGSPEYQQAAWDAAHGAWSMSLMIRAAILVVAGAMGLTLAARFPQVVSWGWFCLLLADLFLVMRAMEIPTAKNFYDSVAPETAALREELRGQRVYSPRDTDSLSSFLSGSRNPVAFEWAKRVMLSNANIPAGISQVRGYDSSHSTRHAAFVETLENPATPYATRERLLDLWDVARIVEVGVGPLDFPALEDPARGVTLVPRVPAIGRATLVSGWSTPGDGNAVLQRIKAPDHDPQRVVLLEDDGPVASPRAQRATRSAEPLEYETFPNRIRVAWHVSEGGMLRLLESWAPGWKARVNGQSAPVYRADYLFMAVPVPEGSVVVELEYRPPMFFPGIAASLVGLLLLATCFVPPKRQAAIEPDPRRASVPARPAAGGAPRPPVSRNPDRLVRSR